MKVCTHENKPLYGSSNHFHLISVPIDKSAFFVSSSIVAILFLKTFFTWLLYFSFRNGSYIRTDDLQSVDSHVYADLEVFLLGLQMDDILPLFKKHGVSLAVLFTMTENDLIEVCRVQKTLNDFLYGAF